MKKNGIKSAGLLLLVFGVFYAYKFKDFNTVHDTYGIIASAIIIGFGLYGLFKSKNDSKE